VNKVVVTFMMTLMLLGTVGCTPVKPWIKPYERTQLANPLMSFGRNPVQDGYIHHVYQAREGSKGAEGGSGGGCGCN